MPLSLEVGAYNGTGPKPPNEQPYPFVPNTYNLLADYWGLWYNLVLHLDFWQFTDAKGLVNGTGAMYPWSGACKPGGATNPGEEIMPDAVLTTWGEQHGALWGGLPRFFSGLDAVYHGWVRVASRSISPRWRSIRFRLALRTYAPWGVRVVSQTKSRKIPTRKHLPLFFASRRVEARLHQAAPPQGTHPNPFSFTPMGVNSIPLRSPHVRPMVYVWM